MCPLPPTLATKNVARVGHPRSAASGTIEAGVLSTIHGRDWEKTLALRAVVFDYGKVLTGPQDPEAHAMLMQLTGLPLDRFEEYYWADRLAYDEGSLTGLEFWRKLLRDAELDLPAGSVHQLNEWDARMWSTVNPEMVAWQQRLRQHGILTGILSNMGDTVLALIEQEHAWLGGFDAKVWSYQLRMVKPDPAIYRHALGLLGTRADETLFLDDRLENIEGAQAVGMQGILFSTVEKLREDLIAAGLDTELPVP